MTWKAAVIALSNYIRSGFSTLPVLVDPTQQPAAGSQASGYVALHWDWGREGQVGGRVGDATYYITPFALTCRVMVPRSRGQGPAWAVVDELSALLREAAVGGGLTVLSLRPAPRMIADGDTHLQIDLVAAGELDTYWGVGYEAPPVTDHVYTRHTFAAAHGLSVGQVVRRAASSFPLALAGDSDGEAQIGMVSRVVSTTVAEITWRGVVPWTAALSGLTVGALSFVSPASAGVVTATEPSAGAWRRIAGAQLDALQYLFNPEPGALL